jgi:hypothetical protein
VRARRHRRARAGDPHAGRQADTAARIAIDLDTNEEHTFLASLARELGVDGELAARSMRPRAPRDGLRHLRV